MRSSLVLRRFCIGVALVALTAVTAGAGPPQPSPPAFDTDATPSRSLAAAEARYGPRAPELLPIIARLAQLRYQEAAFAEATALRRRALKIALAGYGAGSLPAAEAMAALAHLYIEQRRYLDAEPFAIMATNILRDCAGASQPVLAALLADRARIALARGEPASAHIWAEEAVSIDKKSGAAPQSDRLRALGMILVAQQEFAEGERVLQHALALDRAGEDQLAIARSLAALARAYLREKRFANALPAIEEAALIDQTCLGPTHLYIAEDLDGLGLIYLGANRAHAAAKAFRAAVGVLERGAGRNTPTLAYIELDLAHAEHALGREGEAQSLFTTARRILNNAEDAERERQRQV